MSASSFPEQGCFSFARAEKTCFCNCPQHLCSFRILLKCNQINVVKEGRWFAQIDFFHKCFPHWVNVSFLPSQFYVVHIHGQEERQE